MKLLSVTLMRLTIYFAINQIIYCGYSLGEKQNLTADVDGDTSDYDKDSDSYDYDSEYDESEDDNTVQKTIVQKNNITSLLRDNSDSHETSDDNTGDEFNFVDFYNSFVGALYENITVNLQNKFSDSFFAALTSSKVSHQCKQSTLRVLRAIYQRKLWAIKFLDSTAQLPNGLAEGVFSSLGDYDECLDIKSNDKEPTIHGKYCLAEPVIDLESILSPITENSDIHKHLPLDGIQKFVSTEHNFQFNINTLKLVLALNATRFGPFRVGLCVPSDCTAEDIEAALNIFINPTIKIPIKVGPKCDSKVDTQRLNWYQITSIIFFCIIIILVILGTTGDLLLSKITKIGAHQKMQSNSSQQILKIVSNSFSVISNTKILFNKPNERLPVADTMFFLFIVWIFLGRIYCAPLTINLLGLKKIFTSLVVQITSSEKYFWLRTPFPLAILFFVVGIFISYDFFGREIKKNAACLLLWYPKFVFEKWLRFVIRVIGPLMLFYLASIWGSGPYWHLGQHFFLKTNVWPNLFFYTNYADTIESYINHPSLYLSAAFQLQCVFPLFMIPLLFSKRFGISYNICLAIIGSFVIVLPRVMCGMKIAPFEVSAMRSSAEVRNSLIRYSVYAIQHVCQFSIGILTGYLLRNRKILANKWFIQSKCVQFLFSIGSLALCGLTIVWGDSFKNLNASPNLINLLMWFSVGNLLFTIGIAWICYTLCINTEGFLYKLFTCKCVRPLNRLSVGILLIHSDVIYFRIFNLRENYAITNTYAFQSFYIDFPKTVLLSYLLYVLFERPMINLIQLVKGSTLRSRPTDFMSDDNRNYYKVFPLQNGNMLTNAKDIELEKLKV